MPKITDDEISNLSAQDILKTITTSDPYVIPIVGRKATIGNFENIDVALAVRIPVEWQGAFTPDRYEELKDALTQAAELGFSVASEETFARYMAIKEQIRSTQ